MDAIDATPELAQACLRRACRELTERGLISAAKWSAEMLNSLPSPIASTSSNHNALPITSTPHKIGRRSLPGLPPNLSIAAQTSPFGTGQLDMSAVDLSPARDNLSADAVPFVLQKNPFDEQEQDLYLLGKSYLDMREYERAANTLKACKSTKSRFVGLYAAYLAGEKKVQDANGPILSSKDKIRNSNPDLTRLLQDLRGVTDPFLLYLKGLVLNRLGKRVEAIDCLMQSARAYPYNWIEPHLPASFMSRIFGIHVMLEVHSATEALHENVNELFQLFPTSLHLKSQQAMVSYHLREFDHAETLFDDIFRIDPFRLDDIDTYSNILYVMENRPKLSQMAHKYTQLDKYRPETCCLVGNYYSSRGDHEKALLYFGRALKLDRGYLSAWTLMGHEYVELKNSHAAVEAYRRAVDVNPKDYRAWYGLGQTYDILDMPLYSLGYFQKAVALRPYDGRMWSALGGCYEKLNDFHEALKSYKRALLNSETGELGAFAKVTRVCDMLGRPKLAAAYHRAGADMGIQEKLDVEQYAKHCIAYAKSELAAAENAMVAKQPADLEMARKYTQICLQPNFDGKEKDEAKLLLANIERLQLLL